MSLLFSEQLDRVREMDDEITFKRVAQNVKATAKNMERLEKSGITVHNMIMRNRVPGTGYTVVYKVKSNPKRVITAKKIQMHR